MTEPEWEATKKKLLLSTIIQRLSSLLASQYPDIINTDLDSDVTIQTHWVKGGETTPPHTFCQVCLLHRPNILVHILILWSPQSLLTYNDVCTRYYRTLK